MLMYLLCRNLGEVDTLQVNKDVGKGRTSTIEMKVDHSVFTKYTRVKVRRVVLLVCSGVVDVCVCVC